MGASPPQIKAFKPDEKVPDQKTEQTETISENIVPPFSPNQPILKKFEDKGGIFDLIKAAKTAVKLYKNQKLKDMWGLWLSEIEAFS